MPREVDQRRAVEAIRNAAQPLTGNADDYDRLIATIGDHTRYVLIGEASHGTHEFYAVRAQITRQLIEQHGFTAVIVESDWPDAYRVNRYVRGCGEDESAERSLGGFKRFPQWMWRNDVVVDFVEWLRQHNEAVAPGECKCGFYGMDLYSLYSSIEAVLTYLDKVDVSIAQTARERYACFHRYNNDPQRYGRAAGFGSDRSCEDEAIAQLLDLQRKASELAKRDGRVAEDEYFHAEQNARLVKNAEEYYRQMFAGRVETWNLRDTHMADTIESLVKHLDRTRNNRTKVVVWAHNSHLGDARHTEMGAERGELNVGQLCRERWGDETFIIGFTTHTGAVSAADDWGSDCEHKRVTASLEGSWERLLHDAAPSDRYLLTLKNNDTLREQLPTDLLERAIGVIYRPQTERWSHYFSANLPQQFDAVIHVDKTTALHPLERTAVFEMQKAETYPTGV